MSESDSSVGAESDDSGKPARSGRSEARRRWMPKVGGASVGSAMAGIETAVFRTLPPPIEVVDQNRHDGPIVTGDGTMLTITMPDPSSRAKPEESPLSDE